MKLKVPITRNRKIIITLAALIAAYCFFGNLYVDYHLKNAKTLQYVAPEAEADEIPTPSLSVEELENKLDAIVWGGETDHLIMDEGDIFPVFDPSPSMYQTCARIGGKQHKDCISYGPRQEKIGTIQHYYPQLYGKEVSDREARDIAEGNESSRRFFLDCAVQIKGCANNWTAFNNKKQEGQIYIDLIREAKGIEI